MYKGKVHWGSGLGQNAEGENRWSKGKAIFWLSVLEWGWKE